MLLRNINEISKKVVSETDFTFTELLHLYNNKTTNDEI